MKYYIFLSRTLKLSFKFIKVVQGHYCTDIISNSFQIFTERHVLALSWVPNACRGDLTCINMNESMSVLSVVGL